MIRSFGLAALPLPGRPPAVVSIGVFDGVHLGHQAILAANTSRARALGALPTVVTFREHPKAVLLGRSPKILTTIEHRLELFQRAGIGHSLVLDFSPELRAVSAADFVTRILREHLCASACVLGFDSKFGHGREGGPELLTRMGMPCEVVAKVIVGQRAVSSTAIREAVELGDLAGAARMLGRRVSVWGEVVHGDALGAGLGFPTANLDLQHELHPPPGVYACLARRAGLAGPESERRIPAVTNIGYRPTVARERPAAPLVEVHLLDFSGDLYGERMELEFVASLRPERSFGSKAELAAQIDQDVQAARTLLRESAAEASGNRPRV